MKNLIRILTLTVVAAMLVSVFAYGTLAADPATDTQNKILAHWKFQNDSSYFTGDINTDTLKFIDLSGNGNDLEVAIEGNGAQLDSFTWDVGVNNDTLLNLENGSSLKFNNSWELAKSVDPYDAAQTAYSGAYVSGKYLQTVENAPLNAYKGTNGWTIEIIFKVAPEWNNEYNRYTGIFSKQGIVSNQNEPAFSMALTDKIEGEDDGSLGTSGSTGLQYVHVNKNGGKTNQEFKNGMIKTNEWFHYMVTSNGSATFIYLNGEYVTSMTGVNEIFSLNESFGWEVGVGRKLKGSEATMNPEHPEGLIRRLFCGSISEIRFTEGKLELDDCLILENQKTEEPAVTTPVATTTTKAPSTTPAPVTTAPATNAVSDEKGGCKSSVGAGLGAIVAALTLGAASLLKRKKEE